MDENEIARLIEFVRGLQRAHINFSLGCVRDAIMVTIPFPDRYLEAEFFADGRVEVQSFGPPSSDVLASSPEELLRAIVDSMNTSERPDPLDKVFGK